MADDLHDSFTGGDLDDSGSALGGEAEVYEESFDDGGDDDEDDDESFDDDDEDAEDEADDAETEGAPRELDDDAEVEEDDLDLLLDEDAELVPLDDDEDGPRGRRKAEPMGAGEFTCRNCFLVRRRSQLADETRMLCVDCA